MAENVRHLEGKRKNTTVTEWGVDAIYLGRNLSNDFLLFIGI